MPANMIRLGPFNGGLNTFSDPTAIQDTELTELTNLELDIDGSLRNRPPITEISAPLPGVEGSSPNVLGWYQGSGGVKYLVVSNRNDATYYFTGGGWVKICDFPATAIAQARDVIWLVAGVDTGDIGGSWSPTKGFDEFANMPKGGCAIAHKDRVWIGLGPDATSNGARLYLSSIESGGVTWPATPIYLQIGAGDGENIVELAVYYDSLVIFKQGSTYSFVFSSDPSSGEVRKQSENIGALDSRCVTGYQNQLYVVFDNKVYEFANYNFTELSKKVPLSSSDPSAGVTERSSISYWSDRLFVQFYDATYVYSLKTSTWSKWHSDLLTFMGRVWLVPGEQDDTPLAYTYSTAVDNPNLYQIIDAVGLASEEMICSFQTKNYDYQNPSNFKALKTWGIDCISKVGVTAWALPVVYGNNTVTWDELKEGKPAQPGPGGTAFAFRENRNPIPWPEDTWEVDTAYSVSGENSNDLTLTTNAGIPGMDGNFLSFPELELGSSFSGWVGIESKPVFVDPDKTMSASFFSRLKRASSGVVEMADVSSVWAWYDEDMSKLGESDRVQHSASYDFSLFEYFENVATPLPGSAYGIFHYQFNAGGNRAEGDVMGLIGLNLFCGGTPTYPFNSELLLPEQDIDGNTVEYVTGVFSQAQYYEYQEPYGYTWDYLKDNLATWDRLLEPLVQVESSVETLGSGPGRKFIKFPQALRFRQLGFRIEARTSGDISTAPFHVFSIMTKVGDKQYVSRRIS